MLILALLACNALPASPAGDLVNWSGYLYADPFDGGELALLEAGALEVLDPSGAVLTEATRPYDDAPAYFAIEVEPEIELALRVTGPGLAPTVLRSPTPPRGPAFWFQGALVGVSVAGIDAALATLLGSALTQQGPTPLQDETLAALWLEPTDPVAWAGARLVLVDGAGVAHEATPFTSGAQGAVEAGAGDPIALFVAADLAPGAITATLTAADGAESTLSWPAQGGDLLFAPYVLLPEAN